MGDGGSSGTMEGLHTSVTTASWCPLEYINVISGFSVQVDLAVDHNFWSRDRVESC